MKNIEIIVEVNIRIIKLALELLQHMGPEGADLLHRYFPE